VVPAENSMILPPHVLQEPRRPAGSDPYETHEPRDSFEPREWIPRDTTPLDTLVTDDEVTSHMSLATEVDLRDLTLAEPSRGAMSCIDATPPWPLMWHCLPPLWGPRWTCYQIPHLLAVLEGILDLR
jgi:hypothetical protein